MSEKIRLDIINSGKPENVQLVKLENELKELLQLQQVLTDSEISSEQSEAVLTLN
jgi:hypothetical protein